MANIRIDLNGALTDGMTVTFKAPCDCSSITGLKVYYIENGDQLNALFTMKDALVNNLANTNNLFAAGAYVTVVLDTVNKRAFLQNASSSEYLEQKVAPVDNLTSTRADLPLSAKQGKNLNDKFGGTKLSVGTDGAYIEYTLNGSTVKKKLGNANFSFAVNVKGVAKSKANNSERYSVSGTATGSCTDGVVSFSQQFFQSSGYTWDGSKDGKESIGVYVQGVTITFE